MPYIRLLISLWKICKFVPQCRNMDPFFEFQVCQSSLVWTVFSVFCYWLEDCQDSYDTYLFVVMFGIFVFSISIYLYQKTLKCPLNTFIYFMNAYYSCQSYYAVCENKSLQKLLFMTSLFLDFAMLKKIVSQQVTQTKKNEHGVLKKQI